MVSDYTDRLSAALRLARDSAKHKDKRKALDLLKEAYLKGDALRDDLPARPDHYKGVATGVYFKHNLYMHRVLCQWRKRLVEDGREKTPSSWGRSGKRAFRPGAANPTAGRVS